MSSEVAVVNGALLSLGARPINAFTDPTPEARIATRRYADIRDDLLRQHPWNFALKRTSLVASVTAPAWEHTNAYPVPADFLRLHELNNPTRTPYTIENTVDGTIIATDLDSPIEINYVRKIVQVDLMDPSFRNALSMALAKDWAEKLTGNSEKVQLAERRAISSLQAARTADGQEVYPESYQAFDWVDARV